jgi:hypothetical protein
VRNLNFSQCNFQNSRAISILSSSSLTFNKISITDSQADLNHLLYISEAKNLSINAFIISNIRKSLPGTTAAVSIALLQPWI